MGQPTQQQVEEAIDDGILRGASEEEILADVDSLERLSDVELAALGIHPLPDREERAAPPRPRRTARAAPPPPADASPPLEPPPFDPVRTRPRHDGWTAERQRTFIAALAETACVSEACAEVGLTPRSAYRLREHPAAEGFRQAWEHAESMASARLVAIAFDRAIHGSVEQIYKDGELVAERRKPSDRLLMWLLAHHDPVKYGWLSRPQSNPPHLSYYPLNWARQKLPAALEGMVDIPDAACPTEPLYASDFTCQTPDGPPS